jgi:hypothetical protein
MRVKLTQRDKRALVIGGIIMIAAVLYTFGISPLITGDGNGSDEIDAERRLLAKYRQTIAMEEEYQKAINERKEMGVDLSGRLISGSTPALAAAELSNLIRSFAEESNAHINRETVNPARETGSHQKISLQLSITSDVIGLRDFLYMIQNDEKLLDVESLMVTSRVTRRRRPSKLAGKRGSSTTVGSDNTEVELNVTMVVSGYIKAKGEEK